MTIEQAHSENERIIAFALKVFPTVDWMGCYIDESKNLIVFSLN